jgi:hypothetical protein
MDPACAAGAMKHDMLMERMAAPVNNLCHFGVTFYTLLLDLVVPLIYRFFVQALG